MYILEFNHDFNWDNLEILDRESNYFKRCLADIFFIKRKGNNRLNVITYLNNYNPSFKVILEQLLSIEI